MAISATYSDVDTFTVSGDYTDNFVEDRKVRANCGADGYKYGVVKSASYSSPNTTVNLTPESDDLTSNLTEVEWAVVKPGDAGNVPLHTHRGQDDGGPVTSVFINSVSRVLWGVIEQALTWTGLQTFSGGIETDTIAEAIADTGVTIDGLLVKDGNADGVDVSTHASRHNYGGADALSTVPDHDHTGDAGDGGNIGTNAISSKTGADTSVVTGTAGDDGDLVVWNADGDAVEGNPVSHYARLAENETVTGQYTFEDVVTLAANVAAALLSANQQGTGDIAEFQDDGTVTVRIPDQGGLVLVAQAGGYQEIVGLLGYDSEKKRLVLQHESHDVPVPVDGRNTLINYIEAIEYT